MLNNGVVCHRLLPDMQRKDGLLWHGGVGCIVRLAWTRWISCELSACRFACLSALLHFRPDASRCCATSRQRLTCRCAQGIVHADSAHARRGELVGAARRLLGLMVEHLPLDAAADQLAVSFLQQRLPPPPPVGWAPGESLVPCTSVLGKGLSAVRVQLAARDVARLVVEQEGPGDEEAALVYHCLANERRGHARGCNAEEPCAAEPIVEGEADACAPEPGPASGRCVFPLDAALC